MAQVEPMDIDNVDGDFDNKENSLHHSNVLPSCTEKGYEELDMSELNMKLRYSITPASSPMSKSLNTNCLDNRTFDCENYINNVVVSGNGNLTRSLNSTMSKHDMARSLKSLPLQVFSTEDRNICTVHTLEPTLDINVTLNEVIDNDDNISLPSTSSSVIHTPEATTPTKEIPKHDGSSPIMRGLKSVLNMFRSSQSPIQPSDNTPNSAMKPGNLSHVDPVLKDIQSDKCQVVMVSTPIPNKKREGSGSRRSSPLKESIVFNDDLEKELQWKDETTIFFKDEKIPIHKLFPQRSLSCISKATEGVSIAELEQIQNNTEECTNISNDIPVLQNSSTMKVQLGLLSNDMSAAESDGEFVDCETTINDEACGIKLIEKENKLCEKIESIYCGELIDENTKQALLANIQSPTDLLSVAVYECDEIKESHPLQKQYEETDMYSESHLNESNLVNCNQKDAMCCIGCDQQAIQTENVTGNIIQTVNDAPPLYKNKDSVNIRMNNVVCDAENVDETNLKVDDSAEHITLITTTMTNNSLKKTENETYQYGEKTLSTEIPLLDKIDVIKSETFGSLDVSDPIKTMEVKTDEVKIICNIAQQDLNLTVLSNEQIVDLVDDQQINHSNISNANIEDNCADDKCVSEDIQLNLQPAELLKQAKGVENQVTDHIGNITLEQACLELNKDQNLTITKSELFSEEEDELPFEICSQIKAEKILLRDSHLNLSNEDLKPEHQHTVATPAECEELGNLTIDHCNTLECPHENENNNISRTQDIPKESVKASEITFNDEITPTTYDLFINKEYELKVILENNSETKTFNHIVCTNSAQNINFRCNDDKNFNHFDIELCEDINKTPLFFPTVDDLPDVSSKLKIDTTLATLPKDELTYIKSIDAHNSNDLQNQQESPKISTLTVNCEKFNEDLKSDNKTLCIEQQEVITNSNSVHEKFNTVSMAQNGSMSEVGCDCAFEKSDFEKVVKTVHDNNDDSKLDIIKIKADEFSHLIAKNKETVEKDRERVVETNINNIVISEDVKEMRAQDTYTADATFNMSIDHENEFENKEYVKPKKCELDINIISVEPAIKKQDYLEHKEILAYTPINRDLPTFDKSSTEGDYAHYTNNINKILFSEVIQACDGNEIFDLEQADSVDDKVNNMQSNGVQFDESLKTVTVPDILDSVKKSKALSLSENCLNNINLSDDNTSECNKKDLERVDLIENLADICTQQQNESDKFNLLLNDTLRKVYKSASNNTSQVTEIAVTSDKFDKENGTSYSAVSDKDIKSEKINSAIEKPFALDKNIIALPPLSPKISSKGYNFNFDEIDDPFATKSKIRLFSPPEDKPNSFTSVKESILSNNQSLDQKKVFQRRKSVPENRKQPICKNKINITFNSSADIPDNKNNTKAILNQDGVTQDYTDVSPTPVPTNDSLKIETDVRSDLLDQNTLVETKEVFVCQIEKNPNQTFKKSDYEIIEQEEFENMDVDTPTQEFDVNIIKQNTFLTENGQPKNVFNLPEMSGIFVSKSKVCQSPYPALEAEEFSESDFKDPAINSTHFANHSQNCAGKNTENIDRKLCVDKVEYDSSDVSTSSKATDATVHEVNTEDEDTIEGPFFETEDFIDADKKSDHDDMIDFSDVPAQVINDNTDNGEIFIDAEAFQFLLNQNKSNVVADSGRESLFLKFDPLFAKRMSTDGGLAAFGKVQKRQSSPKRISKAPPSSTYEECDKNSTDFSNLNATGDITSTLETNIEDPNVSIAKPMMVVNPAVNSIFSPRKKSTTPPRINRRSLTFTSPAIAVIDRLLSLSGNNSTLSHDTTISDVRVETNETDLVLTQLRELLAEKEIHVHSLRLESKDLKERLCVLESQVNNLETESKQRLRKINELNERLAEKTKINKSMAVVVEEYERTIASLTAEIEQDKKSHAEERMRLISERNEQTAHLASMELAFNDLHSKYEKNKQIILSCKANEDAYRRSIAEFEGSLLKMQSNYELLKQHATSKLNHTNQEFEKLNRTHEAEILKFNAMIKRKEMDVSSLKETLAQKTKANEELTAICDELLNKVG